MNLYPISEKITVGKKAALEKDLFINEEIGRSAEIPFTCCQCGNGNTILLTPYESGFPVLPLYDQGKVLSENELINNGMAEETSQDRLYLGKLTVNDLPTLYFGTECRSCASKYIGIFGYGEKQPGLEMLKISGIWNYIPPV
ncbi:hypothetical protein FY557_19675 [Chryseobacterium sp. SN22]|uniref:hypothetical protein n=1 Tax=Chryseobacterium sp. SN22 TaxID=2606431 RepID=UPI0011EE665E|nr:hypothetical protein [Chryseobacterium sp. SN22]KAA0125994.1 hypothetical protein FY557_19675 [Chryseobacterium sp. SN22]